MDCVCSVQRKLKNSGRPAARKQINKKTTALLVPDHPRKVEGCWFWCPHGHGMPASRRPQAHRLWIVIKTSETPLGGTEGIRWVRSPPERVVGLASRISVSRCGPVQAPAGFLAPARQHLTHSIEALARDDNGPYPNKFFIRASFETLFSHEIFIFLRKISPFSFEKIEIHCKNRVPKRTLRDTFETKKIIDNWRC